MTPSSALISRSAERFLHREAPTAVRASAAPLSRRCPQRLKPLVDLSRQSGVLIGATLFTLVPGRGGEPIISPHLKKLRPFLAKGDFAPGSWGQQLVDELAPADISVEKIAYSAFYMSRLEWVLRMRHRAIIFAGIVTNGGVASTVRDAQVREFDCTVLEDGCAAFSQIAPCRDRGAAAGRADRNDQRGQ